MSNEPLKISDMSFMVVAQIERAPQWTMVRELTMNAIESAAKANGEKLIHWTSAKWHGINKAVIWNTGPGMSPSELKRATDLACSIDKNLGLDENFGIGAKVSSLKNNRLGMRFRSCKSGCVSEVILAFDADTQTYVRVEREVAGKLDTVIDVTAAAKKDGRDLAYDWTEVMLLGNAPDQDTTSQLFSSETMEKKAYVANALYRRFYRLPVGVNLKLDPSYHRFDTTRNFQPIGERYDKFARHEEVEVPEMNLKIHFLHDPNVGDKSGLRKSSRGALGSSTTTCCLVHKDEMYSVMTGQEWSAEAPRFGIPFGAKELCVHIELAEGDIRPSQYRERLISKETGSDILPRDYDFAVRERMPEWVKDVIKAASPRRTEDYSDLEQELQKLLNKYKVKIASARPDITGDAAADQDGEEFGNDGVSIARNNKPNLARGKRASFHDTPEGATTTSLYDVYEKPPQIIMLETPEEVSEKQLKGRAAEFIMETGVLFINGLYEAVDRTIQAIEPDFVGQGDPERIRTIITNAARHAAAFRAGKATVFALAKRINDDWNEDHMRAALTKESLSIATDNYEESLAFVKKRVREEIKVQTIAA